MRSGAGNACSDMPARKRCRAVDRAGGGGGQHADAADVVVRAGQPFVRDDVEECVEHVAPRELCVGFVEPVRELVECGEVIGDLLPGEAAFGDEWIGRGGRCSVASMPSC